MLEFKDKLKLLLEENSLSPEKLADKLPNDKKISASTIRNYLKGVPPRGRENYEILANYFNVSVQYFYDDSVGNPTKENIDIGKEIGLSDKAIENLHILKVQKDNLPNSKFTMLETINLLLEEDNFLSKSLIAIIHSYLTTPASTERAFDLVNHYDWCEMRYTYTYEDLIKVLLNDQNDKLKQLRNTIQMQNNN